jgi:hypothetical protein
VRALTVVLGCLFVTVASAAASAIDVVVLPKPGFPAAAADVKPTGRHFVLRSSRYRSPTSQRLTDSSRPGWAPQRFHGQELQRAIRQLRPDVVFLVYGRDDSSGRYVVGADARTGRVRYAFDLVNFARPRGGWFEEVEWAREADGVLYVENTHLTFASATRRRMHT